MIRVFFSLFLLSTSINTIAQNPIADFSVKSTACLNENLPLTNTSSNANTFLWDICQGDLALTPSVKLLRSLVANVPQGIDIVFDGSEWFGFVANQNGNSILRMDFGSDLSNDNPLVVDLGNFNGQLTAPGDIKIVNEHGMWYGFVYGLSGSILSRINFGSSLKNTYADGVDVTSLKPGGGSNNSGLDLIKTGSTWRLLYTLNNSVFVVNLPTLSSLPQSSDFFSGIELPGTTLGDIVALEHNQNYFAYTVSFGNQTAHSINFGSEITNAATTQNLGISFSGNLPYGIDAGLDNGNHMLFISTLSGNLFRVNLGESPTVSPISSSNLTNFSVLENTLKVALVKNKSTWFAFAPSWSSSRLYRVDFPSPTCVTETLSNIDPIVQFTTEGKRAITLTASANGSNPIEKTIVINVENKLAPSINWQNVGVCKDNSVTFSSDSPTAQNYEWKVDGIGFAAVENPSYIYSAIGTYFVELLVTDAQGCDNYLGKEITIYNRPSANFSLPSGLICTNNEFTFFNTTPDNFDGNLTYQWLIDDVPLSTQRHLLHTFTTGGDKEISLQASIPGCSSESVQVLTGVGEGPVVDFTIDGTCLNESVQLLNASQGDIGTYVWNFGNGQSSTLQNPVINYSAVGNYNIALQTTGTNGCVSTKTVGHTIYSVPIPNFNIDLPPFSCSGSPTQFNDLTPVLTDSNLENWQWNFNDQGAISTNQNPQHTYAASGDYEVTLSVSSDQGCTASINKTITIADSPKPIIQNTNACADVGVELRASSAISASSWQWQVGNNYYFTANPNHVFEEAGTYLVSLVMTGANGCIGSTNQQVFVPQPLTIDFNSDYNCAGAETQFTASALGTNDNASTYAWNFGTGQMTGDRVMFTYPNAGQQEVSLQVRSELGCTYSITKAINIVPAPLADFSFSPSTVAPQTAVQFNNLSANATKFLWRFNDQASTTSTLTSPMFTFNEVGEFPVDLVASNVEGCESIISKMINVAFPFLKVNLADFKLTENADGSLRLSAILQNQGNVSVQNAMVEIRLDQTATLRELVNTILPAGTSFDYTFSSLVQNSPSLEYACLELLVPGNDSQAITELCQTFEVKTVITSPYPNPANASLTLEWISPAEEPVLLEILDNLGHLINNFSFGAAMGLNTHTLNTQDWQAGIYTIRLKSPSRERFFRTIIAR